MRHAGRRPGNGRHGRGGLHDDLRHPVRGGAGRRGAAEFRRWLDGVRQEAIAQGVSPATVDRAFATIDYRPVVVERDRSQPEFVRTFWDYVGPRGHRRSGRQGRERYVEHRATLDRIEAAYGVPGNYVVAFWGLESGFGRIQGDHPGDRVDRHPRLRAAVRTCSRRS